jgi:hypothetical protein
MILKDIGDSARAFVCEASPYVLFGGDFSLNESCYLAAIAGDTQKVEACAKFFRTRAPEDDLYRLVASDFGVTGEDARDQGKPIELGKMYGRGAGSIFNRNPQIGSFEETQRRCAIWDSHNQRCIQFRKGLERFAVAALRNPAVPQHYAHHKLYCRKIGNLNFLFIELPSGRAIAYPDAHLVSYEFDGIARQAVAFMENSQGQWRPYVGPGGKPYAWNGLFVENVVQAGCRDILAAAVVRLEAASYEVVLTVHDEIICRANTGESSLEEFKYLLELQPDWVKALGMPIGAKVWSRTRWAEDVDAPVEHVLGAVVTPDMLVKPQRIAMPEELRPPKPPKLQKVTTPKPVRPRIRPAMQPRCLAAALAYAERGWAVFPVPPGTKKSYKSGKRHGGARWGATKDLDQIRRDFTRWPKANIGIPTGAENGFWVLEADTPKGHDVDGIASLQALVTKHGPLPETRLVESPSGSLHYYFKCPDGITIRNSMSAIAPGIDVRGEGGMVVAPPSERAGKAYRCVCDAEIAPPPNWLLTLVAFSADTEAHIPGTESQAPIPEIEAALAAIPIAGMSYQRWIEIGHAVHAASGGSAEGLALFDAWTQQSSEYDATGLADKWASFHPHSIGMGSLVHWATEADPGWRERFAAQIETIVRRANGEERDEQPNENQKEAPHASNGGDSGNGGGSGGKGNGKDESAGEEPKREQTKAGPNLKTYELVRASTIVMRAVQWWWRGHIARGELEILTGVPDIGKSQVHCSYIAHMTTGRDWPDRTPGPPICDVVMLTAEDNTAHTVCPRLVAAGADLERVHILNRIHVDKKNRMFLLQEDLDVLEHILQDNPAIGLVTVDPITAFLGGKLDSHRATDVRNQLGPLKELAERSNVAFSAITHPAKRPGPKALDHYIGSQAFIAAPRIGHICVPEMEEDENGRPQPTGRVLFANPKHNIYAAMATLAYRLMPCEGGCDPNGEAINVTKVEWAEEVALTADQALAAAAGTGGKAPSGVVVFLLDILANGPVAKKVIQERAAARGFTDEQLRRARAKAGIRTFKETGKRDGAWFWAMAAHMPAGQQPETDDQ